MEKIEYSDVENEDTSYGGEIESPFDPKKIDIQTKTMVLEVILRRLRNNEIDLETFFQRKQDLWDKTKQSRLIESILIRLPLPAFYFDGANDDNWLVVDGLQRLSTFRNFVVDKKLTLENLEYLTQFNGFSFDKLPRDLQRRMEESEITVYIINPGTPEDVKFNLFKRVNTGGLILTAQEIRQALNQGIPADFVAKLAEMDEFKRYKINPKRMLDRDFVTRFIAFYLCKVDEYKPDLDSFLNRSMAELRKFSEDQREKLKKDFKIALNRAWRLFGDFAFRKQDQSGKLKLRNKAIFEVWSVVLSKMTEDRFQLLLKRKEILNEKFIKLLSKDKDFESSVSTSTGDSKKVKTRFNSIENLINSVLL